VENKRVNWKKPFFYLLPPILALIVVNWVTFKTDLSAFIIAGESAEEVLLASEMQSGALSRRYLLSIGTETKAKPTTAFIHGFKIQLKKIEGVVDVWSPGQQSDMAEIMQTLYAHYGSAMYSLNADQALEEFFSLQGLDKRAQLLKKILLSPQGTAFKKIALQDPLLLSLNGFQSLAGQMQQQQQISKDSQYQNLVLETAMAGLDATQQGRIQAEIKRVFNKLNQIQSKQYQLEFTGVPVFAVATQTLIQGDIVKISVFSFIALSVLFLLIFRSFGAMFQVFSLLIIVILISILTTHLLFGYVHGMTVAIGSTLVGICIDYPIHALAHAQTVEADKKLTIISRIWPSMLLGGMTTMIGYIALGISGYPGFQQVAVYAVSGIVASLLLTRFILPGLLPANSQRPFSVPLVVKWSVFCQRFRPWLIALFLMVIGISLVGLKSFHWMKDMQELTPELDYLKKNDQRIRARMTSIEPGRFILVSGADEQDVLKNTERVYPVLEQLKQKGSLTEYFGLYPWLLSKQKQQFNHSQLQAYLTSENQLLWQQALKDQGLSVKHLGTLDYSQLTPLTLQQVLATPIGKLIDSRIINGKQQSIVMIWLADHQPDAVQRAMETMDNAQYFSQRDMLNNMTRDYTDRAKVLLSVGVVFIILLLIVRYKSVTKAVQTLLPAILAAFLILSVWSFTGAAVSFLHLVGFLLVVAICVDYGIFFQENRGGNIGLTYQAMAASMLTSALAFGSLMMAESTSLRILAGVVTLGVLLGFIICPIIIKTETPDRKSV
jgi:predicted exporter